MNVEIFEKISTALGEGKGFKIKQALSNLNPTEASNLVIRFNEQEICFILSSLDSNVSAEIILELPEDVRTKTLKELDNKSILSVLEGLESDDATDLISDLDDEKSKEILENMNHGVPAILARMAMKFLARRAMPKRWPGGCWRWTVSRPLDWARGIHCALRPDFVSMGTILIRQRRP